MKKRLSRKEGEMASELEESMDARVLNASEERYKSFTNQLPVGIYRTTADGRLTYLNSTLARMLDYESVDDLLEMNVRELYVEIADRDKLIQNAHGCSGETIRSEFRLRKKNGDLIWVRDNSRMLCDKEGRPEYFDGMLEDITDQKRTEETLREREKVYRTLFEGASDAIFIMQDGIYFDCNQMAVEMYGFEKKEDLIGTTPWFLSPPKQPDGKKSDEKAGVLLNKTLSGKPQRFYWKHLKSNGEPFDAEVTLIRLDMDKEVFVQAIVRDVTEARRSEQKIRENEANLKAIIENSLESIWSVNTRYEIQYVNEVFASSFRQVFGVELKEGVNIIESLPEDLRKVWRDRYQRVFKNGHFVFEDRIDIGGHSIYVEVSMNPIVVDGKVVAASIYGKDVTSKKLSENELRRQAALRQMLIEISSAYINLPLESIEPAMGYSMGVMGKFLGADRVCIYTYDFEKQICIKNDEWTARDVEKGTEDNNRISMGEIPELVTTHCKGETFYISDIKSLPPGGVKFLLDRQGTLSLIAVPMMSNSKCLGFIGFSSIKRQLSRSDSEQELLTVYAQMLVNIRFRKEAEEELIKAKEKAEESDRLKSSFLANMSHEIRTPMNGILGFLELLRIPDLSEENKSNYLDIVSRSGERLLDTINDIIEISKIESGEMQVHLTDVNIHDLMKQYDKFFRQQAEEKGLDFKISSLVPERNKLIKTDRIKLEGIITNLIKNAIKFTPEGSIEFGSYVKDDSIEFFVKDTGIGIIPDRLEAIFERFVQADLSNTRPHEGSGLGLSIVKAYVDLLGGTISVESAFGMGSTFSFTIPARGR